MNIKRTRGLWPRAPSVGDRLTGLTVPPSHSHMCPLPGLAMLPISHIYIVQQTLTGKQAAGLMRDTRSYVTPGSPLITPLAVICGTHYS